MLPTANACLGRQTAIAYMIHLTEHGRAGGSARSGGVSRGTAFDGQRRRAAAVGPQGGGKVIDFAFRLELSSLFVIVIPFTVARYLYSAFMPFGIME